MTAVEPGPNPAAADREDELRQRLRALLAEELPKDWAGGFSSAPEVREVVDRVCRRLGDERILTLNWPTEYGGAGGDLWEQAVLREEMWAHFEPRGAQYMGLNWVGPTLMHVGTEDQRRRHLPGIASGRTVWCQGFSEPGAGTDLSSLQLRATADGDGWVLNGQKIWTSYAGLADWCFLAARTDPDAPRRAGITIFLVPMASEGITVRPIPSMMGEQHLNEVFFDDVRIGREALLGNVGEGWQVIKLVLKLERIGIARYARDDRVLAALAGHVSREDSGHDEYARALVHARVARLLNYRAVALAEKDQLTDLEASVARLSSVHLDQEVAELALDSMGGDGLTPDPSCGLLGRVEDVFRYARSASIASGTVEVQRMLVARLGMKEVQHESAE